MKIPEELRVSVLAAGNDSHPGGEEMVRQLRKSVWWAGREQEMKQFVESCLGCLAAVGTNTVSPMIERLTPEGVWRECSVDFKVSIGGKNITCIGFKITCPNDL